MVLQYLPNYSTTYLLHILISLFAFFSYKRVKQAYKEKNITSLKYFSKFFLYFGIFLFSQGLPMLIPVALNPVKLGAFYIFGHIFLYISLIYFIQVPFSLSWPKLKKYAVWFNTLFTIAITFTNIIYWNEPSVENGLLQFHVTGPVGPMIGVMVALNLIIFGTIYFGRLAYKSKGADRWKFSLLSIAFLIITVGGPLHDNATSLTQYIIADALILISLIVLFAGIYVKQIIHPEKTKKQVE